MSGSEKIEIQSSIEGTLTVRERYRGGGGVEMFTTQVGERERGDERRDVSQSIFQDSTCKMLNEPLKFSQ